MADNDDLAAAVSRLPPQPIEHKEDTHDDLEALTTQAAVGAGMAISGGAEMSRAEISRAADSHAPSGLAVVREVSAWAQRIVEEVREIDEHGQPEGLSAAAVVALTLGEYVASIDVTRDAAARLPPAPAPQREWTDHKLTCQRWQREDDHVVAAGCGEVLYNPLLPCSCGLEPVQSDVGAVVSDAHQEHATAVSGHRGVVARVDLDAMRQHFHACEQRAHERLAQHSYEADSFHRRFWEGAADAYENAQGYCDTLIKQTVPAPAPAWQPDKETS